VPGPEPVDQPVAGWPQGEQLVLPRGLDHVGALLGQVPGSPPVHETGVLEEIAHGPSGTRGHRRAQARLAGRGSEKLTLAAQALDVVGDVAGAVTGHLHGTSMPPWLARRESAPGDGEMAAARLPGKGCALQRWNRMTFKSDGGKA